MGQLLRFAWVEAQCCLVVVTIVLVAWVRAAEGRLYGTARERTVLRAYDVPPDLLPQRSPRPAATSGAAS